MRFLNIISSLMMITGLDMIGCSLLQEKPLDELPPLIPGLNAPTKAPPVIRLHDSKTNKFFCSGTVIATNYAVTAAHCVQGRSHKKATIAVRTLGDEETPITATAVFYEASTDLALLTGDFSNFNTMLMTVDTNTILMLMTSPEPVYACGFPYGGDFFCSPFLTRRQIYFGIGGSGFLFPGMSGGPVFAEIGGVRVLIAVNTSAYEEFIYVSPLIQLLTRAGVKVAQ